MAKKETRTTLTKHSHNTVQWRIRGFLDEPLSRGDWIESPSFSLFHEKWYLKMYPFGDGDNEHLTLCLKSNASVGIHNALFSYLIRMCTKTLIERDVSFKFQRSEGYGYGEYLCRTTVLENVDTDAFYRSIIISCKIRSPERKTGNAQLTLNDSIPTENLKCHFENMFYSRNFSDIQIKVKERVFDVHKCVIAARSPVFASMLKHDMTEKLSGIIDIQDCEPEDFEDFLMFMYTGKLDKVTSTTAISLYKIADKYDVEDLKEQCIKRVSTGLVLDNICDVLDLAVTYRETELQQIATDFFTKNENKIFYSEKWLIFLGEKASIANEFLKESAKRRLIT